MAQKHLMKRLISLVIRKIQIKATLRSHLIPIRMTKKKNQATEAWTWNTGNTPPFLLWVQTCKTTLEVNLLVSQKSMNSFTSKLRYAPPYHEDTCSTTFISDVFVIARNWKPPRCSPTEEWIMKMWYIYTIKYCSIIKN